MIAKDTYLSAKFQENVKPLFSDESLNHWIAVGEDTQEGHIGNFTFGAIKALTEEVAVGDLKRAHEIFMELWALSPESGQRTPSFEDFKGFLNGNLEKIRLFAIVPILTKTIQEAYKLYQMEQITRTNA